MNIAVVSQRIRAYSREKNLVLSRVPARQAQLLEVGALILAVHHYDIGAYDVTPQNLQRGEFKLKLSSSGYVGNFSYFVASSRTRVFEIGANIPVEGDCGDGGRYVVDVAVVKEGTMFRARRDGRMSVVGNPDLVTFIEAKRLVVYPMLLAQFIGIVHELQPAFLKGRLPYGFRRDGHFTPSLVATGYLTPHCNGIIDGYRLRGIRVNICPRSEAKLSVLGRSAAAAGSLLCPSIP
jgi:hypothetical protein